MAMAIFTGPMRRTVFIAFVAILRVSVPISAVGVLDECAEHEKRIVAFSKPGVWHDYVFDDNAVSSVMHFVLPSTVTDCTKSGI